MEKEENQNTTAKNPQKPEKDTACLLYTSPSPRDV